MSSKLKPADRPTQAKIYEAAGVTLYWEKGSHLAYVKEGIARPVSIPKYNEIKMPLFISGATAHRPIFICSLLPQRAQRSTGKKQAL